MVLTCSVPGSLRAWQVLPKKKNSLSRLRLNDTPGTSAARPASTPRRRRDSREAFSQARRLAGVTAAAVPRVGLGLVAFLGRLPWKLRLPLLVTLVIVAPGCGRIGLEDFKACHRPLAVESSSAAVAELKPVCCW